MNLGTSANAMAAAAALAYVMLVIALFRHRLPNINLLSLVVTSSAAGILFSGALRDVFKAKSLDGAMVFLAVLNISAVIILHVISMQKAK